MPMQIRRTITPNLPPTGLAEGQLGVEMAGVRPRLWIGVPTAVDPSGRRLLVPSGAISSATAPASPTVGDLWYDPSNDVLNFYDGTNWVPVPMGDPHDGVLYGRKDGAWEAVPVPVPPPDVSVVPLGGQLNIVGSSPASQLRFGAFNGGWVRINGTDYPIPAGGILANRTNVSIDGVPGQTLANDMTYYVYLFEVAGTLTVDYSVTGHATSSSPGNIGTEIKAGDNSRSLIGMIRTGGDGLFYDNAQFGRVRSWFNRQRVSLIIVSNVVVGQLPPAWGTGPAIDFMVFEGESAFVSSAGYGLNATATSNFLGVVGDSSGLAAFFVAWNTTTLTPVATSFGQILSEGQHTYQMAVQAAAGSCSVTGFMSVIVG